MRQMDTAIAQDAERDQIRTGTEPEDLKRAFLEKLVFDQSHDPQNASTLDHYLALASVVRDRLTPYWLDTQQAEAQSDARVVCYFSAEFLLGPIWATICWP